MKIKKIKIRNQKNVENLDKYKMPVKLYFEKLFINERGKKYLLIENNNIISIFWYR